MSATSRRAEKIFNYLTKQDKPELFIRQATLAEKYNCSCRSIGRALKQLKEEGLLVDLNKRHQNRCKMYRVEIMSHSVLDTESSNRADACWTPHQVRGDKDKTNPLDASLCWHDNKLSPEAQTQWERYEKTFALVFKTPDLKTYYAQVTWELKGLTDELELYKKTFAGLWEMKI